MSASASSSAEPIVKDPLVRGPLALYPVWTPAPPAPPYLTGPEAQRLGTLRVAEQPGGATVPELVVHNTGALPLLLVEGETLLGAKQDRTLDASVLVPASTAITIAVSCVEAGRWGTPRDSRRSPRHAPTDLRRVKTSTLATRGLAAHKQAEVWDRIRRYEDDLSTVSPTAALADAFEARAPEVGDLVAGTRPLTDQCGVAVAVGGTLRGYDGFDRPETLAAYWDALVAGYALDAIGTPDARGEPPGVEAVEALLAAAAVATRTPAGTAGLGEAATFAGVGVVGTELRWEGSSVHISAFVDETVASRPTGTDRVGRDTTRPIRRRRPGARA